MLRWGVFWQAWRGMVVQGAVRCCKVWLGAVRQARFGEVRQGKVRFGVAGNAWHSKVRRG